MSDTITRPCAWRSENGTRCRPAAMPGGSRGPKPRWCAEHAKARKREINHNPRKPRGLRPECCQGGHLCPQHRQFRDEIRIPVYPLSEQETAWLISQFDAPLENIGLHIVTPADPKGWNTDAGPWEGRTQLEVWTPDPAQDDSAMEWFREQPKWWEYEDGGDWPPLWDGPDSPLHELSGLEWWEFPDDEGEKYSVYMEGIIYA